MTPGTDNSELPALTACLTLTRAMLDAAAAADWASVESLDEERRCRVEDLELELRDQADLPARLDALRRLVAADSRLQALAQQARHAALEDVRRVRGKAKASAQYHDLGAGG